MTDIITISENERRFIAQEIHDHAAQTLLQMNLQVSICKQYLELGHAEEAKSELDDLEAQVRKASLELRSLIDDLRPPVSDNDTFSFLLARQLETNQQREGPPVSVTGQDDIQFDKQTLLILARLLQEILLNIRKHAQAKQITIILETTSTHFHLTVKDDGIGFDLAEISNQSKKKGGTGTKIMPIKAKAIGAKIGIKSTPGQGTTVQIRVPL